MFDLTVERLFAYLVNVRTDVRYEGDRKAILAMRSKTCHTQAIPSVDGSGTPGHRSEVPVGAMTEVGMKKEKLQCHAI